MQLDETENVFTDLNDAIPETELLDSSVQKCRVQVRRSRNRPSRSRLRDSISSTEGDDSLDRRSLDSPLHSVPPPGLHVSSLSPELLLSSPFRPSPFSFDSPLRRSPEEPDSSSPTPRGRYRQLTNATSHEALVPRPASSPCRSCPETSPLYFRRTRRPESEVLVSDDSQDGSSAEPGSPTVVLDKKTKRRFLDLGVTLRRSYVRVRRDKSNRLSMGNREPCENPSRPFVPFSWFSDSHKSSASSSPKTAAPSKSDSQESAFSDDFSPKSPLPPSSSPSESHSSHPYHTLSQSSDEPLDERQCVVFSWSTQQVCDWLRSLNMEHYAPEFSEKNVDGEQLLQLDGNKLKVREISLSTFYFMCSKSPLIQGSQLRATAYIYGSWCFKLIRSQRSEAEDQRHQHSSREGAQSFGQTGKTERKTEEERPGTEEELTLPLCSHSSYRNSSDRSLYRQGGGWHLNSSWGTL
ncbi:sterile alpha motif domain-containing protein 14-like isoform X2 [Hoplias malabaricus]|uniref:sterile alpha motif domain-containing protein 14-like isoform X2 n=1 Tax=Hoplias malabaricus TaxID=27720 RepID=UPI003462F83C